VLEIPKPVLETTLITKETTYTLNFSRAFNTGIYFQNRFFGIQKFQNRDPGFKTGFEIVDE
jgi:hypothetical protein